MADRGMDDAEMASLPSDVDDRGPPDFDMDSIPSDAEEDMEVEDHAWDADLAHIHSDHEEEQEAPAEQAEPVAFHDCAYRTMARLNGLPVKSYAAELGAEMPLTPRSTQQIQEMVDRNHGVVLVS